MGFLSEHGPASLPAPHAPYRTKQDIAYLSIKDWILYGALAPGERLTIREAAESLGISETPVRVALTRLESEGLVDHRSHIGATVSAIRLQDLEEAHVIIGLLQGFAAEQAAIKATDVGVADLLGTLDELEALPATAGAMEFSALNFKFHRAVSDLSGYSTMNGLLEQLFDKTDRGRAIWMVSSHREKARKEHRDVVLAIERHDPAAARAAMEQHWLRAGRDFALQISELQRQTAGESEPEAVGLVGARLARRVG